ncbi:MAG: transposase family protein, partial [Gammaproteobacteria bacterium]|nr:transposase family protein [Gammaproteobacteria bacterium]
MAVDILGPLPLTENRNSVIVVFTDYLTKWVECFSLPDQKASTIAKCLVEGLICRHGCMLRLLSDQGTNFLSNLVKQVCDIFRVRKVDGTPFHPQTDGLTEKFNSTLCQMLSFYVSPRHDDWDQCVPFVSFAYRSSVQASTKESPFYLLYGRDARLPIDAAYQSYRRWSEIGVADYARS